MIENEVGGIKTTPPKEVKIKMKELLVVLIIIIINN